MTAPVVSEALNMRLFDRVTKGGRKLIYRLSILQQPERARACGSGSKAQSDRRPVDPPPVIELRIYETTSDFENGDPKDSKTCKDITFTYSANFFLFATLKHARAMAHGRLQAGQSTNTPPVLTGMPVSGMAYLDRPHEAGYFLFPDLSIRHEGRYKLIFNLYEQTKNESDMDRDEDMEHDKMAPMTPLSAEGSFIHRLDIESAPFNVYSAKKFPGLKESTELSRTVAEQGCRVRIRREVRMRKRDGKHGDGDDDFARRAKRSETPESFRARSLSNSSEHTAPYADGQRRPSGQDYGYAPHSGSLLAFGGSSKPAMSFAQPALPVQHSAQPPPISPSSPYVRSSQPSPYHAPAQPSPYPPPPVQPAPYNYSSRPGSQSYHAPSPLDSYDRRPSGGFLAQSPSPFSGASEQPFQAPPTPVESTPAPKIQLPGISTFTTNPDSLPPRYNAAPTLPHISTTPPSFKYSKMNTAPPMAADIIEAGDNEPVILPKLNARAGSKRRHDSVDRTDERLVNGQRPPEPYHPAPRTSFLDTVNNPMTPIRQIASPRSQMARSCDEMGNGLGMWYERADGSLCRKTAPELIR